MSFKEATRKLNRLNDLKKFRDNLRELVIRSPDVLATINNGNIDPFDYKDYRRRVEEVISEFYNIQKDDEFDYTTYSGKKDAFSHKIAMVNSNTGNESYTQKLGYELFGFKFKNGTLDEIIRFKNLASRVILLLDSVMEFAEKPKTNVFDYFKGKYQTFGK